MSKGKLTARQVATADPGKYEDGAGLRLVVSKSGSRRWVFRFMLNGRSREMGLGGFPDVSLAEVRDKAAEHRRQAKAGIDPIEARTEAQAETEKMPTFTACAARHIRAHRRGWKNAKHTRQWVSTLKTYARPEIGVKPVEETDELRLIRMPRTVRRGNGGRHDHGWSFFGRSNHYHRLVKGLRDCLFRQFL